MKRLLIVLFLLFPAYSFAGSSDTCESDDSSEVCDTYLNEYNVEVCSCTKKVLSIPMIIFGDIKWENINIWNGAEVFIYDEEWELLNKNYVKEIWKYWTNEAFEIDDKVNLTEFEWEAIFKIKYWRTLYSNIKVEESWDYSCNEKLIFQTNKLCKYDLDLTNSKIEYTWWRSWSYSSTNLEINSNVSVKLDTSKYYDNLKIVEGKIDVFIKKFAKENNLQINLLKKEILGKMESYLESIELWNKKESRITLNELKLIIIEFSKELSKENNLKKYVSKNEKVVEVSLKLDLIISNYKKSETEELVELRNNVIKKLEEYILIPKNNKIKNSLILEVNKLLSLLND